MGMPNNKLGNFSFLAFFTCVSLLLFFIFAPFLSILALAAVFAVLLHRPYEGLTRLLVGWKNVSAILLVALLLILFIAPLFFFGMQIFQEIQNVYMSIYGDGARYLQAVQQMIENLLRYLSPGFTFDINSYVGNALAVISDNLGSLVYQTFFVIFETFLMLLALFFFLRDGRELLASLAQASPLGESKTKEILGTMYKTIGSVINGTLINALVRWVLISIAFFFFGIPNATLWGALGGVVGAIPGLGTPFAFIPAIIFAFLQGDALSAVGLIASGIVVVMLVDNMLTAYFFGKGFAISPIFVLFSILGGIVFFGPVGFILGPLVLSVFLSISDFYVQQSSLS
jgi:predicted PurR-regulated permease PerM